MKTHLNRCRPPFIPPAFASLFSILTLSAAVLLTAGCQKEETPQPAVCKPGECGTYPDCFPCSDTLNVVADPVGDTTKTEDGFILNEGELEVTPAEGEPIVFEDAVNLKVTYDDEGELVSIEGRARIPSPHECLEFKDPVQFNMGYFTGSFINENFYLGFPLTESREYFVFRIEVGLEMSVCTNNDPSATKPLSLSAPGGGHLLYVLDSNDPFFYFEGQQDQLGALALGASVQKQIEYAPLQPVEQVSGFFGASVRKGSIGFPALKILEAKNVVFIQNAEFDAELFSDDPLGSISAGYQGGLNGELNLGLSAAGFISFEVPVGQGSAAITAEAGAGGVQARAFVNGLVDPDLSWWPAILPVKPDGRLRTRGFLQQDGVFDIGLEGAFGIDIPGDRKAAEGAVIADNDGIRLQGEVQAGDDTWGASAAFRDNETEMIAMPPDRLLDNKDRWITGVIDEQFAKIDSAQAELDRAIENYQLELSLRGLRSDLPPLVDRIIALIEDIRNDARSQANSAINQELNKENAKLCSWTSKSPSQAVGDAVQPYINALNRMKRAVQPELTDEQARRELEAALRNLIGRKSFSFSYTFKVKATKTWLPCSGVTSISISRKITVNRTVLNAEQVDLLQQAADNVKHIRPAEERYLDAQAVVNTLPSREKLEQLKRDIQNDVKSIPQIGGAGYVKDHNSGTFTFFLLLGEERRTVGEFNPFNADTLGGLILEELL